MGKYFNELLEMYLKILKVYLPLYVGIMIKWKHLFLLILRYLPNPKLAQVFRPLLVVRTWVAPESQVNRDGRRKVALFVRFAAGSYLSPHRVASHSQLTRHMFLWFASESCANKLRKIEHSQKGRNSVATVAYCSPHSPHFFSPILHMRTLRTTCEG